MAKKTAFFVHAFPLITPPFFSSALPSEVSCNYTSRTTGEPAIGNEQIIELCDNLACWIQMSKTAYLCTKVKPHASQWKYYSTLPLDTQNNDNITYTLDMQKKENIAETNASVQKRSAWFSVRIGWQNHIIKSFCCNQITGKEGVWGNMALYKSQETRTSKMFRKLWKRQVIWRCGCKLFWNGKWWCVKGVWFVSLKGDGYYTASPDRIFDGETCKSIFETNTNKEVALPD